MMPRHFCIDIETLALNPNATIVSIACVQLFPDSLRVAASFYERVAWRDGEQATRRIDEATLLWWAEECDEKARAELYATPRVSLEDALDKLRVFLGEDPIVWANPPAFDLVVLSNAYVTSQIERYKGVPYWTKASPWPRRNERDLRTVIETCHQAGIRVDDLAAQLRVKPAHHAFLDALAQAECLGQCFQRLRDPAAWAT